MRLGLGLGFRVRVRVTDGISVRDELGLGLELDLRNDKYHDCCYDVHIRSSSFEKLCTLSIDINELESKMSLINIRIHVKSVISYHKYAIKVCFTCCNLRASLAPSLWLLRLTKRKRLPLRPAKR